MNKQYTKEEYEKLVSKIKVHMNEMPYTDQRGRVYKYGEFFPLEFSPLAYNESSAYDYFPKTKDQVIDLGVEWRELNQKEYETTLKAKDIPDHIKDVSKTILKETIQCAACKRAFRLVEREFDFYKRFGVPIPRLCFNCRHSERVKLRNPMKWWRRKCQCDYQIFKNNSKHQHHPENPCLNEFETTFAPDRPELVYCEQCYQQEIQ